MSVKKLIRTLQVYVPYGPGIKAYLQRTIRRTLRIPSESTYRLFRKFPFEPGTSFLDIGANRGQTIASFRLFQPKVEMIAFEPNPILAGRLEQLYGADPHLEIKTLGLADVSGRLTLHVPSYHGFMFDGLASMDIVEAAGLLNREWIYWFDETKLTMQSVDCVIDRLDVLHTCPALVKIDVQGFEVKVLEGAGDTIARHRPVFIIENDEIMAHADHLAKLGYIKGAYDNDRLTLRRTGDRNSIFIPEEKTAAMLRCLA